MHPCTIHLYLHGLDWIGDPLWIKSNCIQYDLTADFFDYIDNISHFKVNLNVTIVAMINDTALAALSHDDNNHQDNHVAIVCQVATTKNETTSTQVSSYLCLTNV